METPYADRLNRSDFRRPGSQATQAVNDRPSFTRRMSKPIAMIPLPHRHENSAHTRAATAAGMERGVWPSEHDKNRWRVCDPSPGKLLVERKVARTFPSAKGHRLETRHHAGGRLC